MFSLKGYLCIFLLIANIHHSFGIVGTQLDSSHLHVSQNSQSSTLAFSDVLKKPLRPIPKKKPQTLLKRRKKNTTRKKEHPRKKLLEEEPIHTQRAWLYSTIVPGLGQAYNKDYWKLPLIYGVFGILTWASIYNHNEYVSARRELIEKYKGDASQSPKLGNQVEGFKRERTIWVASIGLWYLINIFDAYVGGTLKTFDVSDDLELIIQPTEPKATKNSPGIGLTISLQQKDADRLNWLR